MTMSIYDLLVNMYPDADPRTSWVVQNDSDDKGDYISAWSIEGFEQPTLEAIEEARAGIELSVAATSKISEIAAACAAAITAGFTCSALGEAYTYPAKDTDQANLNASVVSSLLPNLAADWTTPFWCVDAAGNWAYRPHTVAQIQQVGTEGKAQILAYQAKNFALQAQIAAATTVEAVKAIVWDAAASEAEEPAVEAPAAEETPAASTETSADTATPDDTTTDEPAAPEDSSADVTTEPPADTDEAAPAAAEPADTTEASA